METMFVYVITSERYRHFGLIAGCVDRVVDFSLRLQTDQLVYHREYL